MNYYNERVAKLRDEKSELGSNYKLGQSQGSGAFPVTETEEVLMHKSKERAKDLNKTLSKHWVCILPDDKTVFEDGLPNFSIFLGD